MTTQRDLALDHVDGYAEGERRRRHGLTPSMYLKIGLDGYARGFRAGYYLRDELLNQAGLAGFANQAG